MRYLYVHHVLVFDNGCYICHLSRHCFHLINYVVLFVVRPGSRCISTTKHLLQDPLLSTNRTYLTGPSLFPWWQKAVLEKSACTRRASYASTAYITSKRRIPTLSGRALLYRPSSLRPKRKRIDVSTAVPQFVHELFPVESPSHRLVVSSILQSWRCAH